MGHRSDEHDIDIDITRKQAYIEIKEKHDEAFELIDAAKKFEEEREYHKALEKYTEGIAAIDRALTIVCPNNPEETWNQAIQKLRKTRAEIVMQVDTIQESFQTSPVSSVPPEASVCCEETMSEASSKSKKLPSAFPNVAAGLKNLGINYGTLDTTNVLYSWNNAKFYFMDIHDGTCVPVEKATTLKMIIIYSEAETQEQLGQLFFQVEEWFYPLITDVSPCYQIRIGTLIFPCEHQDYFIVIDLHDQFKSESISQDISYDGHPKTLFADDTSMSSTSTGASFPNKLANSIETAGEYSRLGLICGFKIIAVGIGYGSYSIKKIVKPAEKDLEIPHDKLELSKTVSNFSETLTHFKPDFAQIKGAIKDLNGHLGSEAEKHDDPKIFLSLFKPCIASLNAAFKIADGASEGVAIVQESASKNVKELISYKYGTKAGDFAGNTANAVLNIYNVGNYFKGFINYFRNLRLK